MKLIACHINNFGKLSDLNINFNDGVNVINQPNGWGKSTLAAFLKAMLYGFDTKKEPGAFERERKLYKPWQGGTYGGELDFEADGDWRSSAQRPKTRSYSTFLQPLRAARRTVMPIR